MYLGRDRAGAPFSTGDKAIFTSNSDYLVERSGSICTIEDVQSLAVGEYLVRFENGPTRLGNIVTVHEEELNPIPVVVGVPKQAMLNDDKLIF